MSFQPESLVAAAEVAPLSDIQAALRGFAKTVRQKQSDSGDYPRRPEVLKILGDVRRSIDRINAPVPLR